MLPQVLLIGARCRRFLLCRVKEETVNSKPCYEFTVMNQPDIYHVHTELEEEGEEHPILCKRDSSRSEEPAYYESVIKRTKNYSIIDGEKIYE